MPPSPSIFQGWFRAIYEFARIQRTEFEFQCENLLKVDWLLRLLLIVTYHPYDLDVK